MIRVNLILMLVVILLTIGLLACGGGGSSSTLPPANDNSGGTYNPPPDNPNPPNDPTPPPAVEEPPVLTVRVINNVSAPVVMADVKASHGGLMWSEQTNGDGRARMVLDGLDKTDANNVVVEVRKDGYQSTSQPIALSPQDDQTFAEMQIVPVGDELSSTLHLQLWNNATGVVVVSDISGNRVTKVLSPTGFTSVEFTPLVCSEIKMEVRVDGYEAYVERIAYTVISNMSYVLRLEPSDLFHLADPVCPALSCDYLYSSATTWLPTLGENGARLQLNMPSDFQAGVIADGDSMLLCLSYSGNTALIPLEAAGTHAPSSVGEIAFLAKLGAVDFAATIGDGAKELLSSGDPQLAAAIAGTGGSVIASIIMNGGYGPVAAFPGTFTYQQAINKVQEAFWQKAERMILMVAAGAMTGAKYGPPSAIFGARVGLVAAGLTGNSVGFSDAFSTFDQLVRDTIGVDWPADQRFVVIKNPLVSLSVVVAGSLQPWPMGTMWAIVPVEPISLHLYAGDLSQTSVAAGDTQTFYWHLGFGDAISEIVGWRADSLTVWTDDPTVASVTSKSNGYGIQIEAHQVGTTTLRALYQSPPPFNDRPPLPVALHPINVTTGSGSTGWIVCGFNNWDDDRLTVLWSIDSASYDRAVDVYSMSGKETNAVAVSPGPHTVYVKWFDADTGQYYTKQQTNTVMADQTTTYVFDLDEHLSATVYYTLSVDTQPVNGDIYANGWLLGNGYAESDYPAGTSINLSFGEVASYSTPVDQNFTLNGNANKVGIYSPIGPNQCRLIIDTEPIAGEIYINGDLVGEGHYESDYDSGSFIHLHYGDVWNYISPSNEDFTITADTNRLATYTYVSPPIDKRDLTVYCEPGGIGAPITVDWSGGHADGIDSLEVKDLDDGTQVTIAFGPVADYIAPDPIVFDIHSDITKVGTYEYDPEPIPATVIVKTHNIGVDVWLNGENQGSGQHNGSNCHGMWTVTKTFNVGDTVLIHWHQAGSWQMPNDVTITDLPLEGVTLERWPERINTGGLTYTQFTWPKWYDGLRYVNARFSPSISSGNIYIKDTTGQYHSVQDISWYIDGSLYNGFEFPTETGNNSHIFTAGGSYQVVLESWLGDTCRRAMQNIGW